jgi:hypothetical protein
MSNYLDKLGNIKNRTNTFLESELEKYIVTLKPGKEFYYFSMENYDE